MICHLGCKSPDYLSKALFRAYLNVCHELGKYSQTLVSSLPGSPSRYATLTLALDGGAHSTSREREKAFVFEAVKSLQRHVP